MMMLRRTLLASALTLSALSIGHAQAHEFWMVPHDAQSHTGAQVLFELRIGSGLPGKQTPRIPGLVAEFSARDAQGQFSVSGHDNSLVIGHFKPRSAGATVVALQTNPAQITLSASEFETYLREEGLEKIIQQRQREGDSDQPGSELYSRFAKSIVLVDGHSEGFDRNVGLPLELIPQTEPLQYKPGQQYHLRLLLNGKPLVGTQVKAQSQGKQRYFLKTRTDAHGEVAFALPESGFWIFSAEEMTASQSQDADWDSQWASVTMAIGKRKAS
ncbi:DUF4198 domain-containing protein [Scandinavium sp. NPDC088450]|uniref:DUF4198 domain-containing protein n=1 Tax=Scandinavium sp. NPDC088450 TaxID=3364514 RepID=UPI00384CC380